jgi:predicted O-linked N-acetylglucosamine transferase (SPINDLY family)
MNDALLRSAHRAHQAGSIDEAARLYVEVLRGDPGNLEALYSLAQVHFRTARFADAERLAGEAARRQPRFAEAWYLRGCALQRMARHVEAISAFERATAAKPGFAEAHVNRGGSLMALQRYDQGLGSFDQALALNPAMTEAWNNRGNALSALGRAREAVEAYDKALALRPGFPETLVNRGTALLDLGRAQDAWASYDAAIKIQPANADAVAGRANALFELKQYEAAAGDYATALRIDPEYPYALGNLAFSRLHCCDWDGLESARTWIAEGLRKGKPVVNPFQAIALLGSPEAQALSAASWTKDKHPMTQALWQGERFRHEKPRVVYLSGDFREHAVAQAMAGVFERHDARRIESIGVSFGPDDGGALRSRLTRAFTRFIDVGDRSNREAAALIRELEADVVVDLMGFTGDCRQGILAFKPAPIQVNYLGFPGTMSAEYIDYIIADSIVIPESERRHYRENVVSLPHSYLPGDSSRAISPAPARAAAGLPEDQFVFASFNNSYKFAPETFDIWMRALGRVNGSVLWLNSLNAAATRNLRHEAQARDIDPERLIFAPFMPKSEDHLARLGLADLFLDTLPYNAHATALDALWAGVPVVTCPGSTFAGRVAASLLTAIGLPGLIARSTEEYEALALRLADDPQALAAVKTKLARNRLTEPLFDTERFTRDLETAYVKMWERHERGETPTDFAVR